MARVTFPAKPVAELYLIQGELPETRDLEDARQWLTIYRELVTFAERTLKRLRRVAGANVGADGAVARDADERWMEGHLRRLQARLDFWERRLWELAGLDLDVRRRVLTYAGQRLTLTRREAELLSFLARRPGQFFPAAQLVSLAWAARAFRGTASHLRRPSATPPGSRRSPGQTCQRTAPRLWAGVHRVSRSLLKSKKVLQLRPRRPSADEPASRVAITVRTHLSLLQGYADIMEGLSPELKRQILCVMAEKTRELGTALQPFVEQTPTARPAMVDYRRVRERTRQLITEYS